MAVITLRAVKGSPLTNNEVDANFTNINDEVAANLSTVNASIAALTVDDLANVTFTNLADGEILLYDGATTSWINSPDIPSLSETLLQMSTAFTNSQTRYITAVAFA